MSPNIGKGNFFKIKKNQSLGKKINGLYSSILYRITASEGRWYLGGAILGLSNLISFLYKIDK